MLLNLYAYGQFSVFTFFDKFAQFYHSAFWGEDLLEVMAILDVLLLKLYKLYK